MFLYIATAVNNDSAITFWGTLILALLVYRLRRGPVPYFAVLMGVLLGLASITKVSGLVFFPLVGLALPFIHRGLRPAVFREGAIIVLVALLIGGWWYGRNAVVYHDPLTVSTHTRGGAAAVQIEDRLKHDLISIERTFWANPSPLSVSLTGLDQILIGWGRLSLALLALSFVFTSIRADMPVWVVVLSWPIAFLLLLEVFWNQSGSWTLGRLLFPAVAPIMLSLMVSWQYALPLPWRRLALTLSAGSVMLVGLLNPFVSVYPLYHPSREWGASQVKYPVGTVYVEAKTRHPIARLIGYNLPRPYALPGTYVPIELCWEPLGQTDAPYTMFVQLLDLSPLSAGNSPGTWGRRETYPGLGNRPTDRWALHLAFCDTVLTWVFPEAPTPLGAAIEVGFVDPDGKERLQAVDAEGDQMALAIAGNFPVLSPQALPTVNRPARYIFDRAIGLDRVQASEDVRGSLAMTFTWQSLQPVPYDATMFVHLREADGSMLAQVDRQPLEGRFPTSVWLPGQIITDVVSLPLSSEHHGPLVLNVGLYQWPSLQRLSAVDASGVAQPDNAVVIDVLPSPSP